MHGKNNIAYLDELNFLLGGVIPLDALFSLPKYSHVNEELTRLILHEASRLTAEVLAPVNVPGDTQGSQLLNGKVVVPDSFHKAYREILDGGWIGLDMPQEYGGQGLPLTVQLAFAEMLNRACISLGMLPVMQRAASYLLIKHASDMLKNKVVPNLVSGEWAATICITEAQAGSDVGRIQSTATAYEGDTYHLSGTKVFITYGDHDLTKQIVHMVLARTPGAPQGSRGLSLFLVPKFDLQDGKENRVTVSRLENKMGLRASPTCELVFDNALAYRLGETNRGLQCMFTMVNMMRLEVSIQGPALAASSLYAAEDYAQQRQQGGKADSGPVSIDSHGDVQRMLLSMRSRTEAIRALVFETAFNLDLAQAETDESKAAAAIKLAQFLLPVCKSLGSETGFDVCNMAMQVFGGYGYVKETGVEQNLRDVRVAMIYEGTNGIQALDLVSRKLIADGGERYSIFLEKVEHDLHCCGSVEKFQSIIENLKISLEHLKTASDMLLSGDKASENDIEAVATDYLSLVGLVACGWMWLKMLLALDEDSDFSEKKYSAGLFFSGYHMPESAVLLQRIRQGSKLLSNKSTGAVQ